MIRELTHSQINQLEILKSSARKLDVACKNGEITDEDKDNIRKDIASAIKALRDEHFMDSRIFIAYEAEALLSWVDGDDDNARRLMHFALDTKRDYKFITESAYELAKRLDAKHWYDSSASFSSNSEKSKTISQYAHQIGELTPGDLAARIGGALLVAGVFVFYIIMFLQDNIGSQ